MLFFLPPDWPQPSALQHETSLHDVLNHEPCPSDEQRHYRNKPKRFVFSWIIPLWWISTWSQPGLWRRDWSAAVRSEDWSSQELSVCRGATASFPVQHSGRFGVLLRGKRLLCVSSCPPQVIGFAPRKRSGKMPPNQWFPQVKTFWVVKSLGHVRG